MEDREVQTPRLLKEALTFLEQKSVADKEVGPPTHVAVGRDQSSQVHEAFKDGRAPHYFIEKSTMLLEHSGQNAMDPTDFQELLVHYEQLIENSDSPSR